MLYQQDGITVDERFVRFGSKSYAINKINSVDVRTKKIPGSIMYIFAWLFAVIAALVALSDASSGAWVVAALLAIGGWVSWTKRKATAQHQLFLVTSSNEAQAFETTDDDEIARLRAAIEDAMSRSS